MKSSKRRKNLLLTIIFLFTLLFSVSAFALTVSPSEARNLPLGSTITVTGFAYSATDTSGTGFKDEFYLSDTAAKGICVKLSKSERITLYKEYSVTGTLQETNGELKLSSTEISALSGETSRKVKRLSFEEALDYGTNGGTFAKLSGEASDPVTSNNLLSSFTLTKDGKQIRVIIESDVYSLSKGENGKSELTENLRYKRNVTVNGFIAKIGNETVIRIKDCDDIDVQYHVCVFGDAVTEKAPSCSVSGLSVKVCSCGMREETSIPALTHQFYEETERTSTCTVHGLKVKKCRNCSFREETSLPLKDHSFAEKVETSASCTSEGVYLRYCKNCTLREETPIPKTEHSYRERTEVEPTCEREGVRVRYCYYCSFREETAIPKNAHSFLEKTETPATCDKEGVYLRYCRSCTLREETPIPKTEHKFKEKTEKEPTCTEEGVKVRYCSGCAFREETKIPKADHSLKEKTEKEPSCIEEGVKVKYCSGCDFKEETTLPKVDHSYKTKTQKATFTTDGNISEVCSSCGDKKNVTVISAVNDIQLSTDCFIYDGKIHKPTVTVKDKDGKNITDFTLICESRKEIGKHSLTVELKGNYSGKKTLYYTIIPADVTNVKSAVTSKVVTLTFNESKSADGYRIYYINGTKEESLGTFTKNSCSVTLPEYGKSYTIIIRAYKKADDTTLWSEGVSFKVSTGPDNVTGIKADSNFYSVKLGWNKTETADGYRVYIKKDSGTYKILTTTEKTSYTATGLSPDKKYEFAVKAYRKADGKTIWGNSTKKTVSTSTGKPSTFSGKESYNAVALSWREVKGADGYKVYVYSSKKKKYTTLKSVKDNKYTAEELRSGTTYKFAVKPYAKKNSKTYYGKPVYLTVTTKLTRPTLTAKITTKGNTLSWSKVNGADGYVIYYSNQKDGSYKKLKTTTAFSYTHAKTSKSKSYYYKVRAYKTVNGEKIYSSFSTLKKAKH